MTRVTFIDKSAGAWRLMGKAISPIDPVLQLSNASAKFLDLLGLAFKFPLTIPENCFEFLANCLVEFAEVRHLACRRIPNVALVRFCGPWQGRGQAPRAGSIVLGKSQRQWQLSALNLVLAPYAHFHSDFGINPCPRARIVGRSRPVFWPKVP